MKKFFLFCMMALVTMCGLNSCSDDCNHDFIEYDHSADLVGTWTCLAEDYAEALVIKADGSVVSTGVEDGKYWESVKGNIKTVNNKMTMTFEDDDNWEGRFEMVAGVAFTIYEENGETFTFHYCENDLSEEIVGMWVCYDGPTNTERDMLVQTYQNDGYTIKTGWSDAVNDFIVNNKTTYKVVGDLIFYARPTELIPEVMDKYVACRIDYIPNGLSYGDKKTVTGYIPVGDDQIKVTGSWFRIKQHLDLPGQKYDYIKTFVSNVKGEDKDIPFLNTSFNFAKMDGSIIDKFLKSILFTVEFPDANTIKYSYLLEGNEVVIEAPIAVDGNQMTIKMSENNPAYQDVVVYTFQDQDNTQMHLYMHTTSFEKFFANTSLALMLGYGQLDKDDTEGIAGVFQTIADAVESINLSLVMHSSK